jgi:hypothetical protein
MGFVLRVVGQLRKEYLRAEATSANEAFMGEPVPLNLLCDLQSHGLTKPTCYNTAPILSSVAEHVMMKCKRALF